MPSHRLRRAAFVVSAFYGSTLAGQIQPHARLDDEMLPVVTYHESFLYVLKDGSKEKTRDMRYEVRQGASFAEGRVEITDTMADLDPLRDAPVKQRAKPDAIRFRFSAKVTTDRNLSDCYALLTVVSNGSVGTQMVQIGRLASGKPKQVEVKVRSHVDAVGTLHVFSGGMEVRSNQHPEPYEATAYLKALTANSKGLSAAELLKSEEIYPHVLSRNGLQMVTIREQDGKKVLFVYDLESMKLLHRLALTEADDAIRDPTWVSDHEIVYTVEEDFDFSTEWSLRLLDVRTGKTETLLRDAIRIITSLPDRPEMIVVMCYARGGTWWMHYDVQARKASKIDEPSGGGYLFDRRGVARVAETMRGDKYIYRVKATPTSRWQDLDDIVKQPDLRFNTRGKDLLDRVVDIHSVGPDGDILYLSTRTSSDRFELAAFSMSEGVIKQTIARHPKYDLTAGDFGHTRLLFAKNSAQLLGLIFEAEKPRIIWLDPRFKAVQESMDRALPGKVNVPIDWCEDGSSVIYFSTSDQHPGTFYVVRPLESKLIPVLQLADKLEAKALAKTTAIEFPARDGFTIPAYVTRPLDQAGPAPLVVIVHGGPMVRDSWGFDPRTQFLASRGYVVLKVNYRGSSGYGAAFQKAGLHARLDTVLLDDIADGVRFLIARGEVDPSRVAIMGASFGGWATYLSLIKYPDLYRAGVAIAAVSNWRQTLRDERWKFSNKGGYSFWKALLSRDGFAEQEKFIDPYLRAAELKQPIYIMHGSRDRVVSAVGADMMITALRKTNPHVRGRVFPFAGHGGWSYDDRVVELNEIGAFLERHLGPPTPDAVAPAQP